MIQFNKFVDFYTDNKIHVKFLYDNGRRNWVNEKASILPFQGREEFAEKCKVNHGQRALYINSNCQLFIGLCFLSLSLTVVSQ